ncbi:unnamed protein product [Staurois parvus]|uniref:Uncharacterized protein n=1 Tax=Staurois parvus TaxID=386267 RepID=A0ABN9ANR5_9NEOB|nr:unnamed protein product [Staurois parvus]
MKPAPVTCPSAHNNTTIYHTNTFITAIAHTSTMITAICHTSALITTIHHTTERHTRLAPYTVPMS